MTTTTDHYYRLLQLRIRRLLSRSRSCSCSCSSSSSCSSCCSSSCSSSCSSFCSCCCSCCCYWVDFPAALSALLVLLQLSAVLLECYCHHPSCHCYSFTNMVADVITRRTCLKSYLHHVLIPVSIMPITQIQSIVLRLCWCVYSVRSCCLGGTEDARGCVHPVHSTFWSSLVGHSHVG